jgi:N-acetylmuramoyl-L-alanine amidase
VTIETVAGRLTAASVSPGVVAPGGDNGPLRQINGTPVIPAQPQNGSASMTSATQLSILLQPVWMASPNRRPRSVATTLIVVHHTATATASQALNVFMPPNSKSAHYLLDTDGQLIKLVQETEQAVHAGHSHWGRLDHVNAFSIGIEIVNMTAPYSSEQYDTLLRLLSDLLTAFPTIPSRRIVGHMDIGTTARVLGRKSTDPGVHFDWSTLETQGLGMIPRSGPPFLPAICGGFFVAVPGGALQIGDNDAHHRYGGRALPTITTPIIRELQTDLDAIGYSIDIHGTYDLKTSRAVHMFQEHYFSGVRRSMGTPNGRTDFNTAAMISMVR